MLPIWWIAIVLFSEKTKKMKKYLNGLLLLLFIPVITSCGNQSEKDNMKMKPDTSSTMKGMTAKVIYTCPMHHQIRSDKPGKCPICGMTLIPVENNAAKSAGDTIARLSIPPQQQFLANIHTDTARMMPLSGQLVLTGTTLFNPQDIRTISAWVSGWIEKMYVRNPGEMVHQGQKLYDLYSPELLATEKDYQLALKQKNIFKKASVDFTATIQALKQKLARWGLSDTQIKQLKTSLEPSGKVSIYCKASGYLRQKMKEEGDHVNEGDAVLGLAKNNTLWVQAQLYDAELPLLDANPKIWVELGAFPGQKLSGKVVFNNAVNESNSRVHLMNIAIDNPNGRIQPGMLAYVYLQTSNEQPVVVIPKSSVIYSQDNNYVWVKQPDSNSAPSSDRFERRKVKLGNDNTTLVAVLQGIEAGEQVVSSGAYLVNSEYILEYGSGANLSGMQMSDMKMKGRSK